MNNCRQIIFGATTWLFISTAALKGLSFDYNKGRTPERSRIYRKSAHAAIDNSTLLAIM